MTTTYPRDICPKCSRPFNNPQAVTGQRAPQPGDFAMCGGCAAVCRFTETGLELADLNEAPQVVRTALLAYRDRTFDPPVPERTPGGRRWKPGNGELPLPPDWVRWSEFELYQWACAAEENPNAASSGAVCSGECDDQWCDRPGWEEW